MGEWEEGADVISIGVITKKGGSPTTCLQPGDYFCTRVVDADDAAKSKYRMLLFNSLSYEKAGVLTGLDVSTYDYLAHFFGNKVLVCYLAQSFWSDSV